MSNEVENVDVESGVDQKQFDQAILEMEDATKDIMQSNRSLIGEELEVSKNDEEYSQYSEIEREAMAKGWKPKKDFKGNPDEHRSAKEFLDRGKFFSALEDNKKEIKVLKSTLDELLTINRRQHEMLRKEKADYLLQQKRQAISNGNIDDAEQFEQAYYETYIPDDYPEKQQTQPDVHPDLSPAVQEFLRRNVEWFNDDSEDNKRMRDYAIKKSDYLARVYPTWSEEKQLIETERAVKELFQSYFENKNRGKASSVNITRSENSPLRGGKKKVTFDDLPSKYKPIVKKMAQYGGLTLDDYAQQIYDNRGVNRNE